ncbi:uncharacterized protein LOC127862224 isoform X2 [Dreissena polymorpha]|uniref:Uncharacterized protein n=1 Tax=Dreissena polymorpha TaxID=45954 RepID=A0A9D3YC18_DREPO|nr:uncharacterized protein LOC127862224 isoform X2 [Dreissena polymorpha]KAH3695774.1 hypothetical protein DPMN_083233 [Dreissena polymorpha]
MIESEETMVAPSGPESGEHVISADPNRGQAVMETIVNSEDVNNNKNDNEILDSGIEANETENFDGGEGEDTGMNNDDNQEYANDTDEVNNANAQVRTQETKVTPRVAIGEKEPEEIDQFDSVSNTVSQHERPKELPPKATVPVVVPKPETITTEPPVPSGKAKKIKKGVFVSYSPDAGYMERKFVVETIKQLKENNLAEDLWFDKDEDNTGSPCWFSLRMEAVEKCRAAILFLSDSYFMCPVSVYEGKTLIERTKTGPHTVAIFPILVSQIEKSEPHKDFYPVMNQAVDLTTADRSKLSLAEKTSVVIGTMMESLEKYACMNLPLQIATPPIEYTGNYKKKKICQWDTWDLQEWLFKLGIKEFYRQSIAENMVDGFLLMSMTDQDMISQLGIDSRVVRKKIMQNILVTLDKEHKLTDNWHLRARSQRAKPDVVYMIYDPADVRLAQNMKIDLKKKNLQVIHHDSHKLGRSKEDFLEINGPQMATAAHVIVLVTEAAAASPFVFHEILFADWLGKKLVSVVFKNIWIHMRPTLKAVLGECPAIDFETKMYTESLDVLEHHIKPLRRVPGVILEQAYLNKMADGLKPLEALGQSSNGTQMLSLGDGDPHVFISYQWDMQAKVEDIRQVLEASGLNCWADINMAPQPNRTHSSKSGRGSVSTHDGGSDTLQSLIQRNMKASSVVLTCITPKYLQSDNCKKDMMLAETFNKPIIPVLLRFSPFESAPDPIRKILARLSYIDLSNERLYKQNISLVVEKIKKHMTQT